MNDEGLKKLYIAIFKQAVNDDLIREPKRLLEETEKAIRQKYKLRKEWHKRKRRLDKAKVIFASRYPEIENIIRQRVYREVKEWPARADDKKYRAEFDRIKSGILKETEKIAKPKRRKPVLKGAS